VVGRAVGRDSLRLEHNRLAEIRDPGRGGGETEPDQRKRMSVAAEHGGPERAIAECLEALGHCMRR
jgi:hypothetical protein